MKNLKLWLILSLCLVCACAFMFTLTANSASAAEKSVPMLSSAFPEQNADLSDEEIAFYDKFFEISDNAVFSDDLFEDEETQSTQSSSSPNTHVSGRILWEVNTAGDTKPLSFVTVLVYNLTQRYATRTNVNGEFSLSFYSTSNMGFQTNVYAQSTTFFIEDNWVVGTIYNREVVDDFLGFGGLFWAGSYVSRYMTIPFEPNNNNYRAFSMTQGFAIAQSFALYMGMPFDSSASPLGNAVSIRYPSLDISNFCFDTGMVPIMGITADSWNSWYILFHEYGHFVEQKMGCIGYDLLSGALGGWFEHDGEEDLINTKWSKRFGAQLAWSEGWADAFAYIARECYRNNMVAQGNVAAVPAAWLNGATYPTRLDPVAVAPAVTVNSGEGQERAITAFLWEYYMDQNIPHSWSNDRYTDFWQETTISATYIFSDYIQNLYTKYPTQQNKIGVLLANWRLAPANVTVTQARIAPPTITWQVNGSQNTPYNRFRIAFYNASGNFVHETSTLRNITSGLGHQQTMSYTLSDDEWYTVLSMFTAGTVMNISVRTYHYHSSLNTGPYNSTFQTITTPLMTALSLMNGNNAYIAVGLLNATNAQLAMNNVRDLVIPATHNGKPVTQIAASAFAGLTNLFACTLPSSITYFGQNAFKDCANLATINYNAINCSGLTINSNVFLNAGSNVTGGIVVNIGRDVKVPNYLFYNMAKITSINFTENSCKRIGDYAFTGAMIAEIKIPADVTYIGQNAFKDCVNLATINYNAINCSDLTINSNVFLNAGSYVTGGIVVNIGSDVNVPDYLFYNMAKITSINFTENLCKRIGDYAFTGAMIAEIKIPADVTYIGQNAFKDCVDLSLINYNAINGWNLTINSNVFLNAGSNVASGIVVNIGINVNKIPDYLFYNASNITSVNFLTNSLKTIGNYAFARVGIAQIDIPKTITSIGMRAFFGCNNLKVINYNAINCSALIIDNRAFSTECDDVAVNIGKDVNNIPDYLFYNASNITSVNFLTNSSCQAIGKYAFAGAMFKEIDLPSSIADIGYKAFSGCRNLISIVIPYNVTTLDSSLFNECTNLQSIIIPNSVTVICSMFFYDNKKLTVYTEWASCPAGWNAKWNNFNRPVVWGCTLSADKKYVVSINKTATSISCENIRFDRILGLSYMNECFIAAPEREDYVFLGWYVNSNFTGICYTAAEVAIAPSGTYYAKWVAADSVNAYRVTFNVIGWDGALPDVVVVEGNDLNQPIIYFPDNYFFNGWYLVPDLAEIEDNYEFIEYDFNTPITKDIELLAVLIEIF